MSETKINTFKDEKELEKSMHRLSVNSFYGIPKEIRLTTNNPYPNASYVSIWPTTSEIYYVLPIKKVIFNEPATIVFWEDGTKTVVKCSENETFDKEKGLAMAIVKKILGNKGNYFNQIKKYTE